MREFQIQRERWSSSFFAVLLFLDIFVTWRLGYDSGRVVPSRAKEAGRAHLITWESQWVIGHCWASAHQRDPLDWNPYKEKRPLGARRTCIRKGEKPFYLNGGVKRILRGACLAQCPARGGCLWQLPQPPRVPPPRPASSRCPFCAGELRSRSVLTAPDLERELCVSAASVSGSVCTPHSLDI